MKLIADYATIEEIHDNYCARESYAALHYDSSEDPFLNYTKAAFRFVKDQRTNRWETIHDVIREQIEEWNTSEEIHEEWAEMEMFSDIEIEEQTHEEIINDITDRVIYAIARELERIIGALPVLKTDACADILEAGGRITLYGIHINYVADIKKLEENTNA